MCPSVRDLAWEYNVWIFATGITHTNIQTFYVRFYVVIRVYFIKRVEGVLKPQGDLSRQILPLMNFESNRCQPC